MSPAPMTDRHRDMAFELAELRGFQAGQAARVAGRTKEPTREERPEAFKDGRMAITKAWLKAWREGLSTPRASK